MKTVELRRTPYSALAPRVWGPVALAAALSLPVSPFALAQTDGAPAA